MRISKLHPFNYILLSLIGIVGIFITKSCIDYLIIDLIMLSNLILSKIKINWKALLIFCLSLIPSISAFYLSSILFMVNGGTTANSQDLTSIQLACRLFSLAIVSFMYVLHLPKTSFILNLIQRKVISVNIGFALLAVFNAFEQLSQEFKKIRLAYKMRFGRNYISPKIILPLLVTAARYAHTLSISMYARGINQQRSYYTPKIPYIILDYIIILINLIAVILIVVIN